VAGRLFSLTRGYYAHFRLDTRAVKQAAKTTTAFAALLPLPNTFIDEINSW
jgi:hypothetical protein